MSELGDEPIELAYAEVMKDLGRDLNYIFNGEVKGDERKTGFVLLVFPFGEVTGRCNFISNGANRTDLVCLMKEMIAKFEGQPDLTGNA